MLFRSTGVLGLPRVILTGEVLSAGVLASWVLAAVAAFVRGLILISNWAHRSTTRHSTIHHIRGRECHIIQVVDGGMSQTIL